MLAALALFAPHPEHACSLHRAKATARAIYHQTPPLKPSQSRTIAKRASCLAAHDRQTFHRYRVRLRAWRREHRWLIEWRRLSTYDRSWARAISWCESRGNRYAANASGHFSWFQWLLSTWHAAGGRGHPFQHGYPEQAVRAVRWRDRAGSSQWSCKA